MQKQFVELRERLLLAGVARRHVGRYLRELSEHFADVCAEEEARGKSKTEASAAAAARLGSVEDLASAMLARPESLALSARAPWAVFGLGSVTLLAVVYAAACAILWTGWRMFLPGRETPFVPIDVGNMAIAYFGLGKLLYFGGPLLVGWCIAIVAARQRLSALWPAAGLALVALIGGAAQVRAVAAAAPGMSGHVHFWLTWGATGEETLGRAGMAVMLFVCAAAPYVIWRTWRSHAEARG
jgi:hypothetical protein